MLNSDIKISVVVPVYNVEKYLPQCLDSLVLQTYQNLEIICVNDGTKDNSLQILEAYAARDPRIKIISQENKGLSAARNTGIEAATGDYISFIDSDDYVSLGLYEKFIRTILRENKTIDIFVFNGLLYFEYKILGIPGICKLYDSHDWGDFKDSHYKTMYMHRNPLDNTMAVWNKIFRKSWFDQHHFRFPDGLIFEDRLFSAQTYMSTQNIYVLEDLLYVYRQRTTSLTQTLNENIFDIFVIADKVEQVYREHNFFEHGKYSYFLYILRETMFGFQCCRPDLLERFLDEARIRFNRIVPLLDPDLLPKLQNYGVYADVMRLSFPELKQKYAKR